MLPCVVAAGPNMTQRAFAGSKSRHPGGVLSLFGDGSVKFIKSSISPIVWIGLNTISGGEVTSADAY